MSASLSIVVVEPDRDRAILIVDSLRDAGSYDIHVISEPTGLARKIQALSPDVVLIDVESPSRDTLEELALASGPLDRPVAMFVDRDGEGLTDTAIEAGVSAYVVDGMKPQRVKPIMDAAIARFRMFQRMRTELAETKRALEERKMIDRAKGMLMKMRSCNEEEAYTLMRRQAMSRQQKLIQVAEQIIAMNDLLGQ